jgi:hypothetical protein
VPSIQANTGRFAELPEGAFTKDRGTTIHPCHIYMVAPPEMIYTPQNNPRYPTREFRLIRTKGRRRD